MYTRTESVLHGSMCVQSEQYFFLPFTCAYWWICTFITRWNVSIGTRYSLTNEKLYFLCLLHLDEPPLWFWCVAPSYVLILTYSIRCLPFENEHVEVKLRRSQIYVAFKKFQMRFNFIESYSLGPATFALLVSLIIAINIGRWACLINMIRGIKMQSIKARHKTKEQRTAFNLQVSFVLLCCRVFWRDLLQRHVHSLTSWQSLLNVFCRNLSS